MDDKRLKQGGNRYFKELLQRISYNIQSSRMSNFINESLMKYKILLLAVITVLTASCSKSSTNSKSPENMSKNEALEVLKTRRAIRAYQDKMPERELIEQIVEAGTYAPTGMGRQSPIILAVTNREVRDRLSQLNARIMGCDSDPFYGAPVVLVVLADRQYPTYLYDGALVMGNLLNAAHAVGLGSCWIHRAKEVFDTPEGKALLKEWGIEGDYEGIGNCIIGYSAQEAPQPKPRKPDYVKYIE